MASELTILKSIVAQMTDRVIGSVDGDHPNVVQANLTKISKEFDLSHKAAQKVMEVTKEVAREQLWDVI
ncbi:hypothetical protein P10VF_132 [Rhizobium phage vB_RleM_P10VF]|uniref:Uncharacterized protein n=1 Tax=Rhizobium phage vB_RleM_P10VF TaxID=1527770 RepID=A0A076YLW5_9CAUD|nr:hypothetical protein P10VF_132 [Rhizobium phage vB_RleM_P10VF]AIK68345.1 hypothetical protein P10VF_132 [Rhizobium phage vB_RleM_P10VF]